jgi:hypothetical protein
MVNCLSDTAGTPKVRLARKIFSDDSRGVKNVAGIYNLPVVAEKNDHTGRRAAIGKLCGIDVDALQHRNIAAGVDFLDNIAASHFEIVINPLNELRLSNPTARLTSETE